jgi:nucleoside-diphosphate-sugar epimerase
MRVLLTGASGYLGRHVLHALQQHGIETICAIHERPLNVHNVEVLKANLLLPDGAEKLIAQAKATHLMHLAWYVEHGKYWNSLQNFEWLQATIRLVNAFCRKGGQHVVVAGTCAEYDWTHGYMRENATPFSPNTPYGICKDATRRVLTSLCNQLGTRLAWGHVFFPFGLDEDPRRLIPSLIRVFRHETPAFGVNANSIRGMLPVQDTAQAFVKLLEPVANGNYNICSGNPTRIEDIVRLVASCFDADPALILQLDSERPRDPFMIVGDNQRLRSLGWTIQNSLEKSIYETVHQ